MRVLATAAAVVTLLTAGCAGGAQRLASAPADTTYARFLARAEAGDTDSRSVIAFMLFFGEGVPRDRREAHRWFHRAADQGDAWAQRNLAVMHHLGAGVARDPVEAKHYFRLAASADPTLPPLPVLAETLRESATARRALRPGEATYAMFCAGCHGFNGIAEYVRSPSFALGERLDQSDAALIRSIELGRGEMPRWGEKLSRAEMESVLGFVRTLRQDYEMGIVRGLRARPGAYFLFGPMSRQDWRVRQRAEEME